VNTQTVIVYQIRDWDVHFENDRSRNRARCSFVCVPNKQHGLGFSRIMAEPDGAAIYGIWHCIVGACSQQAKRNGWLTVDGDHKGSPWLVDDLALKFRRPAKEIERALEILCNDKVNWMIRHESNRPVTVKSPPGHLEGKGREGNRREGEGNGLPIPPVLKTADRISYERELGEINRELPKLGKLSDHEKDGKNYKRILTLRTRRDTLRELLGVVA